MAQIGSTNGASGGAAPPADAPGYQLIVNTQYLKDLSFESPRAPQTLMSQRETPEVNLTADVKARSLGPDVYEVVLTMGANARHKEDPVFVVELSYAAVVTVKDAPAELVPLLVFVETPRLLFPFARAVIAEATRNGGFPPLLVNPIDFADLLRREHERALREQEAGGAPQPTAQA
ncbi:MAG TPA: protein-export chaperone SecB [Stellaceae bacterium]|jgi:preprotein translocase subunit SecB|nr:protein-export chaperone SecB [Stellaceae bacterium]